MHVNTNTNISSHNLIFNISIKILNVALYPMGCHLERDLRFTSVCVNEYLSSTLHLFTAALIDGCSYLDRLLG